MSENANKKTMSTPPPPPPKKTEVLIRYAPPLPPVQNNGVNAILLLWPMDVTCYSPNNKNVSRDDCAAVSCATVSSTNISIPQVWESWHAP